MSTDITEDRVLDWDSPISNDDQGGEFVVIPAGEYAAEIVDCKREQHKATPQGKLPDCPKAVLTVRCYPNDAEPADVRHQLFLHSRCEGMLCAFFRSIGHRKHGEQLRPDWSRVVGSRCRVKVSVRDYTGNDGQKKQANDIKAFLDPLPQSVVVPHKDDGGLRDDEAGF